MLTILDIPQRDLASSTIGAAVFVRRRIRSCNTMQYHAEGFKQGTFTVRELIRDPVILLSVKSSRRDLLPSDINGSHGDTYLYNHLAGCTLNLWIVPWSGQIPENLTSSHKLYRPSRQRKHFSHGAWGSMPTRSPTRYISIQSIFERHSP